MLTTILISVGALAVILIAILLIRKKRTPADKELEKVVAKVKESLKENLHDSATNLVKEFLWYTVYDPDKKPEDQSPYNRQKRRRIKRHYEKFLWKWIDIPEEAQNVHDIVLYLISTKHETRVVRRYISLMKNEKKEGDKND